MKGLAKGRLLAIAFAGLAVGLASVHQALAQATAVSVTGTTYSQNFDAIVTGSNSSIAAAAPGWSFWRSGTSSVQPNYTLSGSNTTAVSQNAGTAGAGSVSSSSSGGAYLWVTGTLATGTDKSIGFLSTGSYPGTTIATPGQSLAILFGFTNTTGATITNLDLGWNYERYRQGSRTQGWEFYTSADGSTWSANSLGNTTYTGSNTTTVYNPPESAAKAVSIPSLSISNGSNYYLRWSFVTTGSWSNSQALGIDDFTMTLTTSGSVVSTDLYWDGGAGWTGTAPGAGGNGSWADGSGSWDASKKANFGGTAGTVTAGIVTASNGLAFTTTGYTLTGGTIALGGTSIGLNTITTGTTTPFTTTINSVLSGSAGMTKAGSGTLVLGGANTFSGNLAVNAGTLEVASDSALGDAANDISLAGTLKTTANISLGAGRDVTGGGTLDIAPGTTLTSNGSFNLTSTTLSNGGTLDLQGATRSVGTLTFGTAATVNGSGPISISGLTAAAVTSGTATVNPAITFTSGDKTVNVGAGGTLVLNGDISGMTNRIAKTGAGTLIVSGSNSTSGYRLGAAGASPTDGGTLILTAAAASGTGQLQLNFGTLQATGPFTFANGLSIGGRSGAVAVLGGTNPMTFSGSSSFFRGTATSGELRLDVNNATILNGVFGATSGGGSATGITLGGTGALTINGDASALVDPITLQDLLDFRVNGTLGSSVTAAVGTALGGDGTIGGSLAIQSGAGFLFDVAQTLTVNGASVSFGGFGVSNLIGFSAAVPDGTYALIDGTATITTANLLNLGPTNAFDLGDGRSAYFDTTSGGLNLMVVPEPGSLALVGLGLMAGGYLARRRRR